MFYRHSCLSAVSHNGANTQTHTPSIACCILAVWREYSCSGSHARMQRKTVFCVNISWLTYSKHWTLGSSYTITKIFKKVPTFCYTWSIIFNLPHPLMLFWLKSIFWGGGSPGVFHRLLKSNKPFHKWTLRFNILLSFLMQDIVSALLVYSALTASCTHATE